MCDQCNNSKKYQLLEKVKMHMLQRKKLQSVEGGTEQHWKGWRLLRMLLIVVPFLIALTSAAFILTWQRDVEHVPYEGLLRKSLVRANVYSLLQGSDVNIDRSDGTPHEPTDNLSTDKVISCYYNMPNQYEARQLLPADIHPHLCTHINVAFAQVINKEITLDNLQYKALLDVVKLKSVNPKLKILLSIGGAGNDNGFSTMVVNHASRKIFIKSIKTVLRNTSIDGIDLDWEFPAVHSRKDRFGSRERQHFSQLLREIRAEYIREKRNYLLTVAVAAPITIVDISYDVDQLNMYVDYVNVMSYDFHSYTKFTPLTGLNSPLYARATEQLYLATLNINYTVQMYISKGLDQNKIVVGIPTYGHSFTLVNDKNTGIGGPASGFGSLGAMGFVNYPDICNFMMNFKCEITIKQDYDAKVPYLYRNKEWVSYDNPQSVKNKAKYIRDNNLRGAMIYSLNADDYEGLCDGEMGGNKKFPLSQSVKNELYGRVDFV